MEFNRRPPCRRPLVPYSHAVSRALAATSFCTSSCARFSSAPSGISCRSSGPLCSRHTCGARTFRPSSSACAKVTHRHEIRGACAHGGLLRDKTGPSCSAVVFSPIWVPPSSSSARTDDTSVWAASRNRNCDTSCTCAGQLARQRPPPPRRATLAA